MEWAEADFTAATAEAADLADPALAAGTDRPIIITTTIIIDLGCFGVGGPAFSGGPVCSTAGLAARWQVF